MSPRFILFFIVLILTMASALAILGPVIQVYGRRALTDERIERKYLTIKGTFLQTIKLRETYHGDRRSKITQVKVTSNSILPKGTKVKLIDGGVGQKHVTLEFEGQKSRGINLVVSIYGKRPWGL